MKWRFLTHRNRQWFGHGRKSTWAGLMELGGEVKLRPGTQLVFALWTSRPPTRTQQQWPTRRLWAMPSLRSIRLQTCNYNIYIYVYDYVWYIYMHTFCHKSLHQVVQCFRLSRYKKVGPSMPLQVALQDRHPSQGRLPRAPNTPLLSLLSWLPIGSMVLCFLCWHWGYIDGKCYHI